VPSSGVVVRELPVSFLGDATSSLGDAESSLGDAKSSLGDAKSSLGDAKSSLGDAESSLGDAERRSVRICMRNAMLMNPTPALTPATNNHFRGRVGLRPCDDGLAQCPGS
jgi:hypothetical protein